MDVTEVLLESLNARGGETLLFLGALTVLNVERNKLLGGMEQNEKNDAIETNAKILVGALVEELASGVQLTCLLCGNIPTSSNIAMNSNSTYVEKMSADVLDVNPVHVSSVRTEVEQKCHAVFTIDTNGQPEISSESDKNVFA
eukprot:11159843-Ditylum_brightwellii.AAC.1